MRAEYEKARRHAENTLAEVNRHLDTGKITNPRHHHMLTDMAEKATRTLENLDRINNHQPYSDTNIGYHTDARRRRYDRTADDVTDMVHTAMDVVERIIPHLDDRYDEYTDDLDDRRGRPRTTRRGVGRWTQVRRHVRRMPRSSNTDDLFDARYDTDNRYDDDDRYDLFDDDKYDLDDRRGRRMPHRGRSGRFIRSDIDNRYDEDRRMRTDRAARTMDDRRDDKTDDRYDDRTDERTDDRSHRPAGPRG